MIIQAGTKVKVVLSSEIDKGAKLRKGSLGFVTTIGSEPVYTPNGEMLVVPVKLTVTRFGNEKKSRCEEQYAAVIYPNEAPGDNMPRRWKNFIKRAVDSTAIIKNIFEYNGVNIRGRVPCVALLETTECADMCKDTNELTAWVTSLFRSGVFHELFFGGSDQSKVAVRYFKERLPSMVQKIPMLLSHRGEILKFLQDLSKQEAEDVVSALRGYMTTKQRESYRTSHRRLTNMSTLSQTAQDALFLWYISWHLKFEYEQYIMHNCNSRMYENVKRKKLWLDTLKSM